MRFQLRVLLGLVGIGAVILGAQLYLNVTKGMSLTDVEAFIAGMKSIVIASAVMAGGLWLSAKTLLPKKTA